MSWITPVVREIQADTAATKHKLKFFENGTTSNFVVSYEAGLSKAQFLEYVAAFKEAHAGVDNAYKTIHLGGGADVTTVGADMKQLDFKATQGAGETRIASASGAGAVVAMLSEGMQGSALNAGNYNAAKRQFADMTIRPQWRSAAAALSKFTSPPAGTRLWYDAAGISFLQEDAKDAAEIQSKRAATVRTLVDGGFTWASAVAAVEADDLSLLDHTGLFSVQLQPPGSISAPPTT
jgi:phage portal protein BeeE